MMAWNIQLILNIGGICLLSFEPHSQVQRASDSLDVNFIARSKPGMVDDCAATLGKVSKVARSTADDVTPGSELEVRYLSPSQVMTFQPPDEMVSYSGDEVIQSSNEEKTLRHGTVTDEPCNIFAIMKAVEVCSTHYAHSNWKK